MLQDDIEQVYFDVPMDKLALDGGESFHCFFNSVNGILRELAGCTFINIYNREREGETAKGRKAREGRAIVRG